MPKAKRMTAKKEGSTEQTHPDDRVLSSIRKDGLEAGLNDRSEWVWYSVGRNAAGKIVDLNESDTCTELEGRKLDILRSDGHIVCRSNRALLQGKETRCVLASL